MIEGQSLAIPGPKEVANHYVITVEEFVEKDYQRKVKKGEVEVFFLWQPPEAKDLDPAAAAQQQAEYQRITEEIGNVTRVTAIKKLDENYYQTNSGLGLQGDRQLLVFPKQKK